MLDRMMSDKSLQASASQLRINPDHLRSQPRSAFQMAQDERDEIIDLRMRHHEKQRQRLAQELADHHVTVQTLNNKLSRVTSSASLQTSSSSPALLGQGRGDMKRLQALREARVPIADEWFERKYRETEQVQMRASEQHERHLEQQREKRGLQRRMDRANARLDMQWRSQIDEVEEARQIQYERHARAASRKDEAQRKAEERLRQQKEAHVAREEAARQKLNEKRQAEEERRQTLTSNLEKQDEQVGRLHDARAARTELAQEKGRLSQMDIWEKQNRIFASKHLESRFIQAKHAHIDDRLNRLKVEKAEELKQRKADSIRSSQLRQAIIVNATTDWQETLRWTAPPKELLKEALGAGAPAR